VAVRLLLHLVLVLLGYDMESQVAATAGAEAAAATSVPLLAQVAAVMQRCRVWFANLMQWVTAVVTAACGMASRDHWRAVD
jgi:hypothetical protein